MLKMLKIANPVFPPKDEFGPRNLIWSRRDSNIPNPFRRILIGQILSSLALTWPSLSKYNSLSLPLLQTGQEDLFCFQYFFTESWPARVTTITLLLLLSQTSTPMSWKMHGTRIKFRFSYQLVMICFKAHSSLKLSLKLKQSVQIILYSSEIVNNYGLMNT